MRDIRRQDQGFTSAEMVWCPAQGDLRRAVDDHHQRVEWRGMFAKSLPGSEGEESDGAGFFTDHRFADHRSILVLHHPGQHFRLCKQFLSHQASPTG